MIDAILMLLVLGVLAMEEFDRWCESKDWDENESARNSRQRHRA
jgi:hypothetical protein